MSTSTIIQQPVAEMPHDDVSGLLPSCITSTTSEYRVRELPGDFPPTRSLFCTRISLCGPELTREK